MVMLWIFMVHVDIVLSPVWILCNQSSVRSRTILTASVPWFSGKNSLGEMVTWFSYSTVTGTPFAA
jgi:hypothetical protein